MDPRSWGPSCRPPPISQARHVHRDLGGSLCARPGSEPSRSCSGGCATYCRHTEPRAQAHLSTGASWPGTPCPAALLGRPGLSLGFVATQGSRQRFCRASWGRRGPGIDVITLLPLNIRSLLPVPILTPHEVLAPRTPSLGAHRTARLLLSCPPCILSALGQGPPVPHLCFLWAQWLLLRTWGEETPRGDTRWAPSQCVLGVRFLTLSSLPSEAVQLAGFVDDQTQSD